MIKYKQKPLFIVTLLFMMPIVYGSSKHFEQYVDVNPTNNKNENIITEEYTQITQPQDQIVAVAAGRIKSAEYPDTNDYLNHPVCGNKPLGSPLNPCYCGNEALSGYSDLLCFTQR